MSLSVGIHDPRSGVRPEGGVPGAHYERKAIIMAKKKNSRKALAVALGIMGVAGLSVASASQLTLSAENEAQVGVTTFAECQASTITVDYTYDATSLLLQNLTLASIDAACTTANADVTVTLAYLDASESDSARSRTFTAQAVVTGSNTIDISGEAIQVQDDLGDVTVIIK